MRYNFKTAEEAILFGENASQKDLAGLRSKILVMQTRYDHVALLPREEQNLDLRLEIATKQHFCRIALEEARWRCPK